MKFSNIFSYINIPTKDSINNLITNITNDVMFCSRAIKQYTPKKNFLDAAVATFSHASLTLTSFYCANIPTDFIFKNMDIFVQIELVVFYIFF